LICRGNPVHQSISTPAGKKCTLAETSTEFPALIGNRAHAPDEVTHWRGGAITIACDVRLAADPWVISFLLGFLFQIETARRGRALILLLLLLLLVRAVFGFAGVTGRNAGEPFFANNIFRLFATVEAVAYFNTIRMVLSPRLRRPVQLVDHVLNHGEIFL